MKETGHLLPMYLIHQKGLSLLSYYSPTLTPLADQAQTLGFKSPSVVTINNMRLVKETLSETAQSVNLNMFINNLNDNKWDERLTDTEKPIFMK